MKENSALFLKELVEQSIPYKISRTGQGNSYNLDFALRDRVGQASVVVFDDENGLRIIISDFFYFDQELDEKVVDILNQAPERSYANMYTVSGQVMVRKEIITNTFNAERVLETLDVLSQLISDVVERLELIYSVLS